MNTSKDDLAIIAALMYYEGNKRQGEIAETLSISRSYVSQLLQYARDREIVKIHVSMDEGSLRSFRKEDEFKSRFPCLKQCFIMQANSNEFTRQNIGWFAAPHLVELINNASVIGITPGISVDKAVKSLRGNHLLQTGRERTVVQMMGSFNLLNAPTFSRPNEIVENLSKVLRCTGYYLNCPAFITRDELRTRLLRENSIREIFQIWDQMDLLIMGIGVADESSRLFAFYDDDCRRVIKKSSACGEINTHHYDIEGNYLPLIENRTICASIEKMKKVTRRIAICTGAFKNRALLGALRGGYFDTLITDSITIEATEKLMLTPLLHNE